MLCVRLPKRLGDEGDEEETGDAGFPGVTGTRGCLCPGAAESVASGAGVPGSRWVGGEGKSPRCSGFKECG